MSDPRLSQMYEDVDELAKVMRQVAEAHVLVTPPDDELAFILIVASDEGQTGLHTYRNADGTANAEAAITALRKMAAKWMADGGGYDLSEHELSDVLREEFGLW